MDARREYKTLALGAAKAADEGGSEGLAAAFYLIDKRRKGPEAVAIARHRQELGRGRQRVASWDG
jgi:hypothetical protein